MLFVARTAPLLFKLLVSIAAEPEADPPTEITIGRILGGEANTERFAYYYGYLSGYYSYSP